jgi:hypothetical protein
MASICPHTIVVRHDMSAGVVCTSHGYTDQRSHAACFCGVDDTTVHAEGILLDSLESIGRVLGVHKKRCE